MVGCGLVFVLTTHDIANFGKVPKREARSRKHAKINKTFILSLSISDMLVAVTMQCIQLFTLPKHEKFKFSVKIFTFTICAKSLEFEGEYCLVDREWRSSTLCSALGAIVVVGSEQSVLTMTLITIQRVYSIWR